MAASIITGIFIDYNEETGEIQLGDRGHSFLYFFRRRHHLNDDVTFSLLKFVEQEVIL
ncbi:MAG: hypothetical protein K9L68_06150 [Spirochaetales bacterium]|nr:hypothetical protein [Spirochaetales bacterium]MCF7938164.1 hypothetical protein [Spirochaetales bacterium]